MKHPFTVLYRVFIKNCVFSQKIFRTLPFLCFPSVSVRVHTHQTGRTPALQQNWQSSGKNTIFIEHPVPGKGKAFKKITLLFIFHAIDEWKREMHIDCALYLYNLNNIMEGNLLNKNNRGGLTLSSKEFERKWSA